MKLSFESLKITAVGKRLRLTTPPHQGFTEMGLDIINQKKKKKPQTYFFTCNSLRRILECINF